MSKISVLVVDDSSLARMVIIEHLTQDENIEIVGVARNGKEAIDKVKKLKPSIVTMDINMPVMGGLETIEQIMAYTPVPVLVVTSRADADTAYAAISKGALEVIQKPDVDMDNSEEFIRKVRILSGVKVISHLRGRHVNDPGRNRKKIVRTDLQIKTEALQKAVVIAASTGGPKTLARILSEIPENFPMPVFVAQHIPPDFVTGLAEWLNSVSKMRVKPGEDGERIYPGTVYISPADKNMVITNKNRIKLTGQDPECIYSPSCDLLLSSAGQIFKEQCLGIILTGMGRDGVEGIREIRENGGTTLAQDEDSSIVFGMPKVAVENGVIDKIMTPDGMVDEILGFGRARE